MASLSSKPCRHCSPAAGMCQAAEVHMQPAEAGEVMHSRKEPCWVASIMVCRKMATGSAA